jgi:glycosyltransferase involved in cell wall biosynthesis
MKILITIPFKKTGGVFSVCESIVPCFSKHSLTVFKRGAKENRSNKILIIFEQIINYILFIWKLLFNKYDIIFVNSSLGKSTCMRDGIYIILAKILNNKVLLFIHGFNEKQANNKWLMKGFLFADRIIVLANEFKIKLENIGYKHEIVVSKNPVNQSIMDSVSPLDLNLRQKRFPKNILFLARIEETKGIMIALKVFEKINSDYPNTKFYIAGVGGSLKDAQEYSTNNKIKNVHFLGFVSGNDKTNLLKKCDILLFPSYQEGLPVNVLEAMAAGLSIVSRPVGGMKDFFENERMGYVIESFEVEDFVKQIEKIISSEKYFKISEYNYNYARQNFTPKIISEKLMHIMEEIINE